MKKENIVENYLRENASVNLSAKTISERLNITKEEVIFWANQSKFIQRVDPLKVGSLRSTMNVYCYTSNIL